jgi:hypothetical protein
LSRLSRVLRTSNTGIDIVIWRFAKKTETMLLIILLLGFAFSVIPWSVFLILAPGPDNTKVYYISSIRRNKRCNKGQGRRKLNCRGRLRAVSTSFITIKKILIVLGIIVVI